MIVWGLAKGLPVQSGHGGVPTDGIDWLVGLPQAPWPTQPAHPALGAHGGAMGACACVGAQGSNWVACGGGAAGMKGCMAQHHAQCLK